MTRTMIFAVACALSSASLAAGWVGSFASGLDGWKTKNYKNIAALSVEEFRGERAFVVRHSGTNATGGTAWELRGARFAVKPGERLTVVVRACGSVEGMIAPHGYKGDYKTAIRWYGKDGVRIKDDSGYGLENDTGFGISVVESRWQYSFASIDVPSKAAFAEASLGADRPDFRRDDFLAVSMFKVVPAVESGSSGSKSSLRDDGVLLVDGEPFFPIGVYSVRKCKFNGFSLEKAFADLKDAGFNTVLNGTDFSVLEEFLALADRTGMKTFIQPGGNSFDADIYAKGFLQSHRGHPSVIAWYVADDTASYASPGEVADRHRVCHALDPDRLTLQADGALMEGINRYAPYVHFTDVFLPEIYPYGFTAVPKGDEIAKFVGQMRAVGAALKENGAPVKGIWPIVQFFKGWSSSQYFPNERELRAQCFAALAHRARGLMLYLYGSRNEQKNEGAVSTPERWAATRRVFREVASIQSDLLLRDAAEQPTVEVVAGPKADALGQPSISLLLKTGESPLLIAVNSASERVRVRFGVKGFARAEEVFERRAISAGADGFEDEFGPIGVHVYRLSSVSAAAQSETNFAFRARLLEVHPARQIAADVAPVAADEVAIGANWRIVPIAECPVLRHAARDFEDYVGKWKSGKVEGWNSGVVEIGVDPSLKELQSKIEVDERRIRITGATPREAFQGCIRLEDEMNARGRPALRRGVRTYTRLFSPRMTHSGYAVETFPDEYLDQLAHSGMDAILVFIEDPPDVTRAGKIDMNALVARAAERGIGVWAYASFPKKAAKMHPLDPGAREWYDATYGAIVKNAPGLKGLICVGESCGFPSRDPGMGGYWWQDGWEKKGTKLNGFWPVSDWPEWLDLVKSVTRAYNKDFEVVFWTYNWFKKPAELRLPLLEKIPTDLTLLVTWVRGDPPVRRGNAEFFVTDYSIAATGPSAVFRSEADVAVRRGIPVMTISNTGGRTWDSGVAPYVPAPGRWKARFDALKAAQKTWGLKALMESHHYGFQPNFISELAKTAFTAETTDSDFDRALAAIARREFGDAAAPSALAAWKDWDEAFAWHSTGDADFWGPLRVGPVYPLVKPGERLPPPLNPNQEKSDGVSKGTGWKYMMPKFVRPKDALDGEIETCEREIALLEAGVRKLESAMPLVPAERLEGARRILGVGKFYLASVRTLANVKRFYRAGLANDSAAMLAVLDDEARNVREAIPVVEFDSSLGWEPTMGYVCDRANLEWKLRQLAETRRAIGASENAGRLALAVRGRVPGYTIVLPESPSPSQVFAAGELQKYVREMTGVALPIATNVAPERGIFLGNGAKELGNDGFRLVSMPPHFRIEGSAVHGTLFGVYDFLERYCGCEWLSPNLEVVPPRDKIEVSATLDDVQKPAFPLRDLNWTDHLRNVGFSAKLKVNGFRIEYPEELGGRDHAKDTTTGGAIFDSLCPPSKYFKAHPEWFALLDGKRVGIHAQRCLTNRGFLDFLVGQMKGRIAKNYPRCKYYSIYPNDFKLNCQCADCKALDDREGSPSASLVHMANYVAERVCGEYPDVNVLTFAYMYTLKPPKTMKVHPNVMICYCTDACDFSKPIRESRWKGCREFVENFRKWKELTDKIYIWDYSANFKYLFQPFECTHVMPENFRYFREMGVFGVFEEGDHYGVKCVDEALKTWVIGHLLWNPDQPLEPLLDRFFRGYYGAAADVARGYYDALVAQERKRDEEKEPLVMWGTKLNDPFQPVEFFDEWSAKWTAALELVKDDPVRRENVYWARHNVDLVRIVRSRFGAKYSLLAGDVDDPKGERAALKPVAERILADFARVKGLNKFRDSEMVRARVEGLANADLTASGSNADRVVVPVADMRVDDRTATKRVDDPLAAGGKAIRMGAAAPGAMHHCLSFHEDSLLKNPGAKIGVRVHARVEKTGVMDGSAFSVGTCDTVKYSKRDIRNFHVAMDKVAGDGYHWYDVEGTWSPAGSEKLWIGNGKRKDLENPCIKAVYFDKIELYRKAE